MNNFCVTCGSPLTTEARFCQECGAVVAAKTSSSAAPAPSVAPVSSVAANKPLSVWMGILIGLGMCAFSYVLVGFGFQGKAVLFLIAASTSLWAAMDSVRMQLREYATILAAHPALIFIGMIMFAPISWPVMFAWYLIVRSRIQAGQLKRRSHLNGVGWTVLFVPVGSLLVVALVSHALFTSAGSSMSGIWTTDSSQLERANSAGR